MWWVNLVTGEITWVQDVSYKGELDGWMLGPFKTFTDAKRAGLKELTRIVGIVERQKRQGSNKPTND